MFPKCFFLPLDKQPNVYFQTIFFSKILTISKQGDFKAENAYNFLLNNTPPPRSIIVLNDINFFLISSTNNTLLNATGITQFHFLLVDEIPYFQTCTLLPPTCLQQALHQLEIGTIYSLPNHLYRMLCA